MYFCNQVVTDAIASLYEEESPDTTE